MFDINVGVQKKWYGSVTVSRIDAHGCHVSCVQIIINPQVIHLTVTLPLHPSS